MGAGGFRRAPAGEPPRLVAQPDGYADYVDPARAPDSSRHHGQHRYSLVRGIFANWPGYVGLSSIRQGWRGGLAAAGETDGVPGQETGQGEDER
jgi:hypothetical protein